MCYFESGQNLRRQQRYIDAEFPLQEAIRIRRTVLGYYHPQTALAYGQAALNFLLQHKDSNALPLYRKALEIALQVDGPDKVNTAIGYRNLGLTLTRLGQYDEAECKLRTALRLIRNPKFDTEGIHRPLYYNELALLLDLRGKHATAEPLYREALKLVNNEEPRSLPGLALADNNLATNLNNQGRYREAEGLFRDAVAILEKLKLQGRYPNDRSLNHDLVAFYNNLGQTLIAGGNEADGYDYFRKAATIMFGANVIARDLPYVFHTVSAKEAAKAQSWQEHSLRYLVPSRGDHPTTATAHLDLAKSLYAQGKFAEAGRELREAMRIRRKVLGEDNPDTTESYLLTAFNFYAQSEYAKAEEMAVKSAASYEASWLDLSFTGFERVFAADATPLNLCAALLARNGKPRQAWERLESNFGRGLRDEMLRGSTVAPDERAKAEQFAARVQQIDYVVNDLFKAQPKVPDSIRKQVSKAIEERNDVQLQLTELRAKIAKTLPPGGNVWDYDRIQRQLPEDAALLAWADVSTSPLGKDPNGEHWACVVRHKGAPVFVKLVGSGCGGKWTRADIELPDQFRKSLKDGHDVTQLRKRLTKQRLEPILPQLQATGELPRVRSLTVIPAGWMFGVPVELLTDKYTVSYAPSATMYAYIRGKRHKRPASAPLSLLAVGYPSAFETQVEAIGKLFPKESEKLLAGTNAREQELDALSARLRSYRYVHFSTHGEADDTQPWSSALSLNGKTNRQVSLDRILAGQKPYNGRLTAGEILHNWHLDADLVTLSACESGLGRPIAGEGYLGFVQAFFVAGSRSVVVSLWKVDADATRLLMDRFYKNLLGKRPGLTAPMTKAAALHEAKVWLRSLSKKEVSELILGAPPDTERPFAAPTYWAAFILFGEPV